LLCRVPRQYTFSSLLDEDNDFAEEQILSDLKYTFPKYTLIHLFDYLQFIIVYEMIVIFFNKFTVYIYQYLNWNIIEIRVLTGVKWQILPGLRPSHIFPGPLAFYLRTPYLLRILPLAKLLANVSFTRLSTFFPRESAFGKQAFCLYWKDKDTHTLLYTQQPRN